MTAAPTPIDPERFKTYAKRVFGALGGAMTSAMIYLGDRLGLYRTLCACGAVTSEELAQRTGLSERWLREWLHQQGAAGVLDHLGEGRFALSPEGAAILADESHPAFGAGFFASLPQTLAALERLPEAFRTGIGLPYDAAGPEGARGVERGVAPWFKALLVPLVIPRLPGVRDALERGATVADVGCGSGQTLLTLARAFPHSSFHGWEISRCALERAEENRRDAGSSNVFFHDIARDPLPASARFDFVLTLDCLHDMTDPAGAMRAIRRSIRDDGTWLVCEIKSHATYEENVARNPMAPMMYGTSVLTCMSSALSEPGGAGLGTLGLHAALLRRMVEEAGFTRFESLDFGHPVNAFYAIRP
ncbi:MAG: methyltransferase domain-containing protein [Deltaproteobacteria bacterium]|nr:methyltransferase domain-containing protein [Deltaproteobacteria bacterium]